ncbi:MAG: proline racemase family protein [Gemmatimonadota bacterium]|nr:MAG: proline racemase family protein [Gemmatimonadota bacterium]
MTREADAWGAWSPPESWRCVLAIDAHTAGEPLRVILGGFPELPGHTILERQSDARERYDSLRTALMWEPRGHSDMYGCVVLPPETEEADLGVLFTHNEGFSTMCGHGIIGVTRVVLDLGLFPKVEPVTSLGIDTPAGFVRSFARVESGTVLSVFFHNVASWVVELDAHVEVPGIGRVRYDLAFGGAFYAYVDADALGLDLTPAHTPALIDAGRAIKQAAMGGAPIHHPTNEELGFLYGTIFVGPARDPANHSRNVCVFADGEVDRSPTGTGVSGRLAIHHARGELAVDEPITVESIIGSVFRGRVVEETHFGGHPAIVPEVEGQAYITARQELVIDPADPFGDGFLVR